MITSVWHTLQWVRPARTDGLHHPLRTASPAVVLNGTFFPISRPSQAAGQAVRMDQEDRSPLDRRCRLVESEESENMPTASDVDWVTREAWRRCRAVIQISAGDAYG